MKYYSVQNTSLIEFKDWLITNITPDNLNLAVAMRDKDTPEIIVATELLEIEEKLRANFTVELTEAPRNFLDENRGWITLGNPYLFPPTI